MSVPPETAGAVVEPESMPEEEAARVEVSAPQPTVGALLRAAREAGNLSIVDVAQSLKFSSRQIELIEADDYAALPGNTVVRGLTRSYARLLRLDPEELLHMLDSRSPPAPADVRPPDNMGIASDANGGLQLTPVLSAAIVIALAALFLGLWHFFGPSAKQLPEAMHAETREAPAPQLQSVEPAAVAAPEAAAPPAEAGALPAVAGPTLVFVFEDRSWLEVSDVTQQRLHSGENPAGTRLTLAGRPPFDIVVGNAGKVKLTYGEREIDLAPHTRAEVARLKLE
ncbi:MAG: helix-turn-helix domain-containing protein [Pseudomonadota bacterium]